MSISCDCSPDLDCCDQPSCERTIVRKARKPHSCCECGDTIEPGQRYEYNSGIWDGHADEHKTCLPCAAIRDRYCPGGYIFGDLVVQIMDCLEFDYRFVPGEEEDEDDPLPHP